MEGKRPLEQVVFPGEMGQKLCRKCNTIYENEGNRPVKTSEKQGDPSRAG